MTNDDDDLLRALGRLPRDVAPPDRLVRDPARAAFVRAFQKTSPLERFLHTGARASVPVVLAGVVGLYLFWAFAAAIAVVQ